VGIEFLRFDAYKVDATVSIARFAHLVKEAPFLDFTTNSVYNDTADESSIE